MNALNRRLAIFMGVLAAALALSGAAAVGGGRTSEAEPEATVGFQPVGHRGLVRHAPENSLAGFAACIDLKVGFELDVRRTRDGRLVCIHDETVVRTTNGTGKVSDLTFAELQQLDAGAWFDPAFAGERIPALEQIFALLSQHRSSPVLIAVDLKSDDEQLEADVVALAVKHQVLPQLICIGRAINTPIVRQRLLEANAKTPVARLANTAEELPVAIEDSDAQWVYIRFVPDAEQVRRIHHARKRVIVAGPTVVGEERENWRRAMAAGVDSILTDYPLECREMRRGTRRAE
jgi:glycerophosphoryl diester phosphodiesterase